MEPEVRERFEFIEKTLAYVAQSQKKAEVRADRADARAARVEARADRMDARADRMDTRMDRFDKRLDATRKLVETGMRMLVKLAESQRDTDRKLKLFLGSITKGRNGRTR